MQKLQTKLSKESVKASAKFVWPKKSDIQMVSLVVQPVKRWVTVAVFDEFVTFCCQKFKMSQRQLRFGKQKSDFNGSCSVVHLFLYQSAFSECPLLSIKQ